MLQFEELAMRLNALRPQLTELGEALGIDGAREEITKLVEQSSDPEFWNDMEKSQVVLKKLGALKARVGGFDKLSSDVDDADVQAILASVESSESGTLSE